jgi:hypothetical protein
MQHAYDICPTVLAAISISFSLNYKYFKTDIATRPHNNRWRKQRPSIKINWTYISKCCFNNVHNGVVPDARDTTLWIEL